MRSTIRAKCACPRLFGSAILALALALTPGAAVAENEVAAEQAGFTYQAVYKADLLQGLSQRIDRHGQFLGNLDLKLGWRGRPTEAGTTRALIHLLYNHGDKPNERYGTAQGVSNIETPVNTGKVYQAWLELGLFGDDLTLLAGLYDLNSEFYVTDSSAMFIHPAFGTGAELAQTGRNGPSIFPNTSVALRARMRLGTGYLQGGVFDGVPGDPDNRRGTHIRFKQGDGVLQIVEAGIGLEQDKLPGKFALGTWRYSARFDDQSEVDAAGAPLRRRNRGTYLLFDYPLLALDAAVGRGVNVFLRAGEANPDINRFHWAVDAGATWRGPFAARPDDAVGIGFAYERNSRKARELAVAAHGQAIGGELSLETDYRAQVLPRLVLQPNLQYLRRHGDGAGSLGWLAGLRVEIALP
jgi:porin